MAKRPPKTIEDATLGALRLSSVLPNQLEYSVDCELNGRRTELTLYSQENSQDMTATLEVAAQLVSNFKKVETRLSKYLVSVVLKAVNTNLRSKNPITADSLKKQLQLTLIDIHATGDATFWYGACDVLLGHGLVLYGKSNGDIQDFDTPG